jgi:Fe-S-cluster containining protein
MDYAGYSTALVFDLKKESLFSFKCQVCGVCCTNKAIRIAPYEALRLARHLKITTTEVYRTYTEEDGAILRNKPDGTCIFLNSRGCGVHPDRPLVCRLFPLGQIIDGEGEPRYASMPLHPDCLGLFDTDGTVDSYLEAQGTRPYFHYDHIYSSIHRKIGEKVSPPHPPGAPKLLSSWLDIDGAVASYCRAKRKPVPQGIEETISLHIRLLEGAVAGL